MGDSAWIEEKTAATIPELRREPRSGAMPAPLTTKKAAA
jgi:hypothetical protein